MPLNELVTQDPIEMLHGENKRLVVAGTSMLVAPFERTDPLPIVGSEYLGHVRDFKQFFHTDGQTHLALSTSLVLVRYIRGLLSTCSWRGQGWDGDRVDR